MLDAAFQAGTDTVLNDMAQRPRAPRVQAPRFSLWGTIDATARGAAAGLNQVIGSTADILGAFGDVAGAYPEALGVIPDDAQRKQADEARKKLLREGPSFMSPAGETFRSVADGYMPDATTSHASELVVADFFRVATKAVGAALTLGPLAGAAVAGAEEGFSQSDALARKGVDLATRSKVGAVTGVVTAAGLALPVAGRTWAQTVGLAVAGGPASFVGQNAANRAILEAADYTKQAEQFDPFDPVGLALSTLLPLGFGALAMRGAAKARAAGRPVIPPEVEDAARANLLRENVEAHRLTPAQDIRAAGEHQAAVDKALEQMAAGQRVDVSDVLAARAAEADRIIALADELGVQPWDIPSQMRDIALPRADEIADELRSLSTTAYWAQEGGGIMRDPSTAIDPNAADAIYRGDVVGRLPWIPAEEWFGNMRRDLGRDALSGRDDIVAAVEKAITGQKLSAAERRTVDYMRAEVQQMQLRLREVSDLAPDDADDLAAAGFRNGLARSDADDLATVSRAAEKDPDAVERAAIQHENDDAAFMAAIREIVGDGQPTQAANAAASAGPRGAGAPAEPAQGAGGADTAGAGARADAALASPYDRAVADLEALSPDLPVQMDGMAGPVPLRELLAMMREEVQADLADVPLLEAAATCFIRTGAAVA